MKVEKFFGTHFLLDLRKSDGLEVLDDATLGQVMRYMVKLAKGKEASLETAKQVREFADELFNLARERDDQYRTDNQRDVENGYKGAEKRWGYKHKTEKVGGYREAIGGLPENDRGAIAKSNQNSNKNENKNTDSDFNVCSNHIESNSNSQPDNAQQGKPSKPDNAQQAYNYAMSCQWLCTLEDVQQWYKENDDRKWINYKTDTPLINWGGSLRMWLYAKADKRLNDIIEEKAVRFGQGKAEAFGCGDKQLDIEHYTVLQILYSLSSLSKRSIYKKAMEEYEKLNSNEADEQPF